MNITVLDWSFSPEQAIALQQELRSQVVVTDQVGEVRYVAGVDVGFEAGGTITRAAVAVLNLNDLQVGDRPSSHDFSLYSRLALFSRNSGGDGCTGKANDST